MSGIVESLVCPECRKGRLTFSGAWCCGRCQASFTGAARYLDRLGDTVTTTGQHYALQWGSELGFLKFLKAKPAAKKHMPAGQLGWDRLIGEIRERAVAGKVSVYDAACGFGGIASDLVDHATVSGLTYLGADVHSALEIIHDEVPLLSTCGFLVRMDVAEPPPVDFAFDYVICRAALHHTPDPPRTFGTLARTVKPGGTLAISVYNKKSVCREALDDRLRELVSPLPPREAFERSREFTVLGRALQNVKDKVHLGEDLELLGIPQGDHSVHELVYYYFLKCFHNDDFGEAFSTLVNYDWYHPAYAFRYHLDEARAWFEENGLDVIDAYSIPVQHFLLGKRRADP